MKKFLWGMLLVGSLVVSGCSSDEGSQKVEANTSHLDTPEGVENGLMTQDFYEDVYDFFMGYEDFKYDQSTYIVLSDPNFADPLDTPFRKEVSTHIESFQSYLDKFEFKGKTKLEKEFSELLNKFVENKTQEAEFIGIALSLGKTSPESYGLLLMMEEDNDKLEDEIYGLLEDNKISPNH